ncbi:MAG: hypothetical protein AUH25_00550 [Thaumarchaeota archaeon 13_1_40CM_38_12]|nr:MAG: hypothetical protein AUH25_00550 [Thaumarchaeota archaeon 13_1_40CM_38_12]
MSENLSQITKERMIRAVDYAYQKRDFQMFMTVMTHAQTCKQCSKAFFECMRIAQDHLESELI